MAASSVLVGTALFQFEASDQSPLTAFQLQVAEFADGEFHPIETRYGNNGK